MRRGRKRSGMVAAVALDAAIGNGNVFPIDLPDTATGAPCRQGARLPAVRRACRRQLPIRDERDRACADGSGGLDSRRLRPGCDDHVRSGETMN